MVSNCSLVYVCVGGGGMELTALVGLAGDVLAGLVKSSVHTEVDTETGTLVEVAGSNVGLVGDLVGRRDLIGGDGSNHAGLST